MSLIGFQTALGRNVRARTTAGVTYDDLDLSQDERRSLQRLIESDGFRTTMNIQRSWCEARSANGAQLTLSALPREQQRRLVKEWVDGGGGTNSFFAAEAEAFLAFIGERLSGPSHALSLCYLEQAVLRAEAVSVGFAAPDPSALDEPACRIGTGRHAAMVALFAEASELLTAIRGECSLPPLSDNEQFLLVAPGVRGLARPAEAAEIALWQSLGAPQAVARLLLQHDRGSIETLWREGAIEAA